MTIEEARERWPLLPWSEDEDGDAVVDCWNHTIAVDEYGRAYRFFRYGGGYVDSVAAGLCSRNFGSIVDDDLLNQWLKQSEAYHRAMGTLVKPKKPKRAAKK